MGKCVQRGADGSVPRKGFGVARVYKRHAEPGVRRLKGLLLLTGGERHHAVRVDLTARARRGRYGEKGERRRGAFCVIIKIHRGERRVGGKRRNRLCRVQCRAAPDSDYKIRPRRRGKRACAVALGQCRVFPDFIENRETDIQPGQRCGHVRQRSGCLCPVLAGHHKRVAPPGKCRRVLADDPAPEQYAGGHIKCCVHRIPPSPLRCCAKAFCSL